MAIVLTDDGTLDTVLRCTECGEELRYHCGPDEEATQTYDEFVEWAIKDAESDHACDIDEDTPTL